MSIQIIRIWLCVCGWEGKGKGGVEVGRKGDGVLGSGRKGGENWKGEKGE